MELENGSAPHLTRDTRPYGYVPSSRGRTTPLSAPIHCQSTRKVAGSRRKRSTEQAVSTVRDDATDQENQLVVHQRTSSVETIRRRSSKSKKFTDSAGHETTSLSITSAGTSKQKSKFLHPSTTTVSVLEPFKSCIPEPHKPRREKAVKKSDSVPLFTYLPAIFNVGHADVATGIATHTTTYLSIDASDDLSRWDMDNMPTIPSIHSPPGSPGRSNAYGSANTVTPPSNSNPFSTPIDDDALLENDIPFPLNRHSKVVLENMGVKKSKTLAKARTGIAGSILNRQSLFLKDEPPVIACNQYRAESQLPGLPNPLPLRTLCQNTETQPPLGSESTRVFSQTARVPVPRGSPGLSAARKDAWGCVHLGAADLELSIVFPQTAHFEIWDMGDDAHIACPAMLCLMAKDPVAFSGMPLALPDVSLIDIRCEDLPVPLPKTKYEPQDDYYTSYTGSKTGKMDDELMKGARPKTSGPSMESISLEGQWVRTYAKPGVEGSGRSRVLHRGDDAAKFRGWYLKFWVPIPTRLFRKRESRTFYIHARVWMMGDEQRVLSLDENEEGQVYPLVGDAEMTVSHLRKEREMEWWWRHQ